MEMDEFPRVVRTVVTQHGEVSPRKRTKWIFEGYLVPPGTFGVPGMVGVHIGPGL